MKNIFLLLAAFAILTFAIPSVASAQASPATQAAAPAQTAVSPTEAEENQKLLDLNALLRKDEAAGLDQVRQILKDDSSERLKEGAVYLLALNPSSRTRELLTQIAEMSSDAHSNPQLQAVAKAGLEGRLPGTSRPAPPQDDRAVTLDVVVTDKSGHQVQGLQSADFQLLDNRQPQGVVSFEAASGVTAAPDPPAEVIFLVDAINLNLLDASVERRALAEYLRKEGGRLALPASIAFVTDTGAQLQGQPTRDANALIARLNDKANLSPSLAQQTGVYVAEQRWRVSLQALNQVVADAANRPGRKLVIWLSSGWPAFSRMTASNTHGNQVKLFNTIVSLSTGLRKARITLYGMDPIGVGEKQPTLQKTPETENEAARGAFMPPPTTTQGQFYFEEFLKGVDRPEHADFGDLLLGVLATQSGGQFLFGSNDSAAMIKRCVEDASAYYVLAFRAPQAAHADEYHELKVVIDKPGLKARTRTGYYAQP